MTEISSIIFSIDLLSKIFKYSLNATLGDVIINSLFFKMFLADEYVLRSLNGP